MIVFNLSCDAGHAFEGWFGSSDAYDRQHARGLLECPVCGVKAVTRRPSAPRLNLGGSAPPTRADQDTREGAAAVEDQATAARGRMIAAQTAFYQHLRQMLERSDNVGDRFAEEARRIHYKETPERQIHGLATREETAELLKEGIAVMPVPMRIPPKDELN